MKHTQGTWEATQGKSLSPIVGIREKSFFKICELNRKFPFSNEEAEANAKLIAAAPDLLKVCTDLLNSFIHVEGDKKGNQTRTDIFKYCPEFREIAVAARHAIEKATKRKKQFFYKQLMTVVLCHR